MRTYWTLVRRELAGFFLSLSGYVIIAAALFLMGYSFVIILGKLQKPMPMAMPVRAFSERGVSKTRWRPYFRCRSKVLPNMPEGSSTPCPMT